MTAMQSSPHVDRTNGGTQFSAHEGVINGSHVSGQTVYGVTPGQGGVGTKLTMEHVDVSQLEDESDSDADGVGGGIHPHLLQQAGGMGPKPGKKTKGRVKIKMEFIENKLRRYTTFSKRKTGIMKKAYELSTLTGTQVMLLVASETGHVYTFATRKLQPMITSESGKALIQTCLNSPDPPPVAPGQQQAMEQRMNPTGFEETELTYAVSEDEGKEEQPVTNDSRMMPYEQSNDVGYARRVVTPKPVVLTYCGSGIYQHRENTNDMKDQCSNYMETSGLKPMYLTSLSPDGGEPGLIHNSNSSPSGLQIATVQSHAVPSTAYLTQVTNALPQTVTTTSSSGRAQNAISLQLPTMPPGVTAYLQPGAPITIPIQQPGQTATSQHQTVYRLPTNGGQLVSLANISAMNDHQSSNSSPSSINLCTGTGQAGSVTPGLVMYQTPQGIVYAPTTATLPDRSIFNFSQQATALSIPQSDQQGSGQQIITIPVPVSLAGGTQVLHLAPAETSMASELPQPTPPKKSRK